jgi:ribonuclease HI
VKPLVSGFPDAKYKSFSSLQRAKEALQQGREPFYQEKQKPSFRKSRDEMTEVPFIRASIAVDAACSGNPGLLEYRGVDLQTGEEIFHQCFDL